MRLDDSSLASLLLTNRLIETDAKPLTAREYWTLIGSVEDPAILLGRSAADLDGRLPAKVTGERVATLLDAATALAFELEQLEQSGITAVTPFDAAWPDRLTKRLAGASPTVLYAAGRVELLATDGLGIVGSHDEREPVVRDAVRVAVELGVPVVTSGAADVEPLPMNAAVDAHGSAIGVLADSLTKALHVATTRRAVLAGTICLTTPYKPSAGSTVASATGRSKIIYGLSRLTLVVATDDGKGGTWAGATEALTKGYGRVAVWSGAGDGNEALAEMGATRVATGADLAAELRAEPARSEPERPTVVQQQLL